MRGLHVEFCICFPGVLLSRVVHQLLIGDHRDAYCMYLPSINAVQMMPPRWIVYRVEQDAPNGLLWTISKESKWYAIQLVCN
jgi:hypothetical protein